MFYRWRQKPDKPWLERLCNVIAWNLWQMDGIKGCVPVPPKPTEEQLCLFPPEPQFGLENLFGEKEEKEIACRLFDWRGDHSISYQTLREKGSEIMKFDFIIGNPPYQDETIGDNKGFAPPIYHLFMDGAYQIGEKVELIHPARFLFNAGSTPKAWNQKMLDDPHLKVLHYESDASMMFRNTEIKGGVAITYHDCRKEYTPVTLFTPYSELNSIIPKTEPPVGNSLMNIIYIQNRFDLDALYLEYPEYRSIIGSDGKDKRFRNNIFDKISAFKEEKTSPDDIATIGVVKNKRVWRYIPRRFIDFNHENLSKWKVLVPRVNGSGVLGDVLSSPIVSKPYEAYTQTFIGIGGFDSESEAQNCLKYVKTKFSRALLGILKITQDNNREVWRYIPLQDFTPASDIDWSKSIPEIDRQLYAKYGLDDAEIAFIESHVKEMS